MSVVNFCLTVLTAGCSSSADCHHTAVFFTILLCILVFSIYNSFGCLLFDMMMMKHFASSGRRFQILYFTAVNTSVQMDTYSIISKIYFNYILCSIVVPFGALMLYVYILNCVITRLVHLRLLSFCQGTQAAHDKNKELETDIKQKSSQRLRLQVYQNGDLKHSKR